MALMIYQLAREKFAALEKASGQCNVVELRQAVLKLLAIYPDFTPALLRLAGLQEELGEFSSALQTRQHAIALDPQDAESWVSLARLHHEHLKESQHAIQALKRALEIEPNHAEALSLRIAIEHPKNSNVTKAAPVNNTPIISAIVSTYKSERFLRGCLEDLERQTIADRLEIIVVDSASPQNERAIVEEFQQRYSNIVYIRTDERETLYAAWNRAIKSARGKYLTNANTDDRHRADALEVLVRALEENSDATLAYADCLITTTENETFESTRTTRQYKWLDFDKLALVTRGCFVGPQPVWRREVLYEHGYFDGEFVAAGDYEFWLKIARTRKFLHVRETLGLYLESATSVEHSNGARGEWESWEARRRHGPDIISGYKIESGPKFVPARRNENVAAASQTKTASEALPKVALIGNLAEARELLKQKNFSEAWKSTITALQARPFHPEAFLLLAEIALASGDVSGAKKCARRAQELAPNWSAAKQFLKKTESGKQKAESNALTQIIAADLSLITHHSSRLSVCLIAKNEEQFLAQCLKSIAGLAQQIIVVDTGSTDRTIEIAREHGAEVYSFAWCDDFSAARNAALERATGDWILMLDADEELSVGQSERLLADIKSSDTIAHRLPLINRGQEADGANYVPRLFRNAPGVFYHGRIHEQVFPSLVALGRSWGLKTSLGTAQLLHHGYTKEMLRDRNKIERNLKLLQQACAESSTDANLVMNFGLELVRSGDLAGGITKYREAFRLMSAQTPEDVPAELREVLLTQFTSHLYKVREHEEVLRVLNSSLAKNGGLTASLHFVLGLSNFELKNFREAAEQMRQCLSKRSQPGLSPINTDIHTAAPQHCLALSLAKLGDVAGAEKAFQAALAENGHTENVKLDYAKFLAAQNRQLDALHKLHEMVGQNCRHAAAWKLGGEITLSRPDFLEFGREWIAEAARQLADDIAITAQHAEALLLSGDTASARELWERIYSTANEPRALAALILCETLEAPTTHAPAELAQEISTSRAFVAWYQRLIAMNAQPVIERLNEQTEKLSRALPTAAGILEKALVEAQRGELVAASN